MFTFKDRKEAAERLFTYLTLDKFDVVVGIPRGGVIVASKLASLLNLECKIVICKKIPFELNSEVAIGALTSDEVVLDQSLITAYNVSSSYIQNRVEELKLEIEAREQLYAHNLFAGDRKRVLLVDDGAATGWTLIAASRLLKKKLCNVTIAIPVCSPDAYNQIKEECDKLISLETPFGFKAVGMYYAEFPQVTDDHILYTLKK